MKMTRREFGRLGAGVAAGAVLRPVGAWAQAKDALSAFGLEWVGQWKTRPSSEIPASPLSVGFETLDRKLFDPSKVYAAVGALGVKHARCQTGWARCETEKGRYDFGWLDDVVDNLLKVGVRPWFNVGYGHPLYTPQADATAVGWVPVFDETAMAGWLAFTEALATHFKGRVSAWEIWNEPNIKAFWKPGEPDAARYVRLVERTAPVIRRCVPDAVIVGGAFAGVPMPYYTACLEAGLPKWVDKISYHPYRSVPEKGYEDEVKTMRRLLDEHGASGVQLWQGENGCPSKPNSSGALGDRAWTEADQAKWLTRRMLSDLRLGVEQTSYFLIVDLLGYRNKPNWKGLLRGEDYTPKPAYFAYQRLASLFDAETRLSPRACRVEGAGETSVLTASFVRRGQPLFAYWTPSDLPGEVAPSPVRVVPDPQAPALVRPMLVDPLTGHVYSVASLDRLPLIGSPLLLVSGEFV